MAITVSDISSLVGRYANDRVEEQVNLNAPYMNMVDKLKQPGLVGIVNIKKGGLDSTGWIADSGSLPLGASVQPEQGTYLPKFMYSRLLIPRGAATLSTGKKDGINIVFEQLDTAGADLARQACSGLINDTTLVTLTTAQATQLATAGPTLTVPKSAPFRVGQIIERRDNDTAQTLEEYMRVTNVAIDDDGVSHTLTLDREVAVFPSGNGATGVPAAGDTLHALGAFQNAPVSLSEVADATGTVYGHAAEGDWSGNEKAAGGNLTVQQMRDMDTVAARRRGQRTDFILANSRTRQLYSDTLLDQRRYHPGSKMDATGGVEIDFEGKPVKCDENVSDDTLFGVKKSDIKIHEFVPFGTDGDGDPKNNNSKGHMQVSQSTFDYDGQMWGAVNTRCTRRNGLWKITGITGS
jgi:hypothetical protein